jgi:hypothetical protein
VLALLSERKATAAKYYTTINAAFLQEIKEANAPVWESLHGLRRQTSDIRKPDAINNWVFRLTDFRRQLSNEFALEETYGYISKAPRQHIMVGVDPNQTLKQHRELYLHLVDICEQVEQAQYVGHIVRDIRQHVAAFQEFDSMLAEHERIEAEMIRYGLGLR